MQVQNGEMQACKTKYLTKLAMNSNTLTWKTMAAAGVCRLLWTADKKDGKLPWRPAEKACLEREERENNNENVSASDQQVTWKDLYLVQREYINVHYCGTDSFSVVGHMTTQAHTAKAFKLHTLPISWYRSNANGCRGVFPANTIIDEAAWSMSATLNTHVRSENSLKQFLYSITVRESCNTFIEETMHWHNSLCKPCIPEVAIFII